jgi:hypothetical protein
MLPRRVFVICLSSAILLVAGCGGSDSGGATTSARSENPLTKAAFLKTADNICEKALKDKDATMVSLLKKVPASERGSLSTKQLEELAPSLLPPLEDAISQIDELQGPEADRSNVSSVIEKFKTAIEEARANPGVLVKGTPFQHADEAAAKYGLEQCWF